MAKFAVGEIAIYIGPAASPGGDEVEVIACSIRAKEPIFVGAYNTYVSCTGPADYCVLYGDAADPWYLFCEESNLRKRPQRGIPDEVLRVFEVPRSEDATA